VDVETDGKTLTLLINHLKAQDGKKASVERRKKQAARVRDLAAAAQAAGKFPIVLGDLNVDHHRVKDGSLDPLVKNNPILADPFPKDEWTHYYSSGKTISRLDYILPDKRLNVLDKRVLRKGLTTKAKKFYDGERYPTIGPEHTEASDHCPTSLVLEV
jgi:endonuclease/exonuclease/phosphatase family metal-dependent hydrolase